MTMSGPGFIMGCTCLQIRQSKGHLLVVPPVPECLDLCPIAAFDVYTSACVLGGVGLRVGYLFPPILTAHGSRAGCAITLSMLGATQEAVMEHCRWATARVCKHYTKLEQVRRLDDSARLLQRAVVPAASGVPPEADSAAVLYELLNSGLSQESAL